MYEDLERLNALREKGAITEEEYQREKERILNDNESATHSQQEQTTTNSSVRKKLWGMDEKGYCALMHISQFAGMIIPFAGYVMPIVMWVTGKEDSEVVDRNGRNILNWMISVMIYLVASGILCVVGIGFVFLIVLGILNIVFVIKGTIKANQGEEWKYPMSIKFF